MCEKAMYKIENSVDGHQGAWEQKRGLLNTEYMWDQARQKNDGKGKKEHKHILSHIYVHEKLHVHISGVLEKEKKKNGAELCRTGDIMKPNI